MAKNNIISFENSMFRFTGDSCYCAVDTVHNSPDCDPDITFKIQSEPNRPLTFAYSATDGLVRFENGVGIVGKNILAQLISTKDNDLQSLISFFDVNGFLFATPSDSYESISAQALVSIINHIKATVRLMSAISEARRLNYNTILDLTLYLLLSEDVTLDFSDGTKFRSCIHGFTNELSKASMLTDSIRQQNTGDMGDSYIINDLIYPPSYSLDINEYNNIVGGYSQTPVGATDSLYKNITKMYCNLPSLERSTRLIIDFLFHFERNIGVIKGVDYVSGIEYYSSPNFSKFDKPLKNALLEISKNIIGEEINSHLSGIVPEYDVQDMQPSWHVQNLIDALYLSIFYLRPDLELFRKCENPSCDNYFLVKTTSTKKKYCCESCANAAQQRRYRLRKKRAEN